MEPIDREKIDKLAEIVWKNTGDSEPYGGRLDVQGPKYAKLGEKTKDIYRRIAAAVALALGHPLAEDVSPKPREIE